MHNVRDNNAGTYRISGRSIIFTGCERQHTPLPLKNRRLRVRRREQTSSPDH
jgi:hypothetical protein